MTNYELNFWKGVLACLDKELPKQIPNAKNKKEVIELISIITTGLDESQIERVCNLPTYRWTAEARVDVVAKIAELEKNIQTNLDLIANPGKIKTIYKNELKGIKS